MISPAGASEGCRNPIVGGGGALVYPSIHSPNYQTGVTGWTINKDGSVEFNSGVFRGTITAGTFQGTNFVINSSGAFFYSSTPALGNLIVSIASAAGTDAFGNVYPEGINVTTGTISGTTISGATITGTTFDGTDFVINSSGAFFYSSTPASGNLIASIARANGTDSFGNTVYAGVIAYNPGISIAALSNGDLQIGTPAQFANTGGAFPGGVLLSGSGLVELVSGLDGTGDVAADIFMVSKSASNIGVPYVECDDALVLEASNQPTFQNSGSVALWSDANGIFNASVGGNDGLGDGWQGQIPVTRTGTTPVTVTQTVMTNMLNGVTIPASDLRQGTGWRIKAGGHGQQASTAVDFQFQIFLNAGAFTSATLGFTDMGTAFVSGGGTFHWAIDAVVLMTGASQVSCWGQFSAAKAVAGGTSFLAAFDTQNASVSTGVQLTLNLQSKWASTTGSPTITCVGSLIERIGP